jgi:HK97 family phage prohead protease
MPYVVEHRDSTDAEACPVERPWGVYSQNEEDGSGVGSPHGCHESEDKAKKQQAALYVALEKEQRSLSAAEQAAFDAYNRQPQLRSASFEPTDIADDGSWFEGYAAVFDEIATYEIAGVGPVDEEVRRGAFRRVLSDQKQAIPMLYHHLQEHPPLATTTGGTLLLEERAKGFWTRANVARTYIGDAVRELVKRGDIPGMSWGFEAPGRNYNQIERRGGRLHRTIIGFQKILDVSPTWDVTYRGTTAEFRSRTFGLAIPPELTEQIAAGVPVLQRGDQAEDSSDGQEESRSGSGATLSVAARKRALDLFIAETGGDDA